MGNGMLLVVGTDLLVDTVGHRPELHPVDLVDLAPLRQVGSVDRLPVDLADLAPLLPLEDSVVHLPEDLAARVPLPLEDSVVLRPVEVTVLRWAA